MSVKNIISSFFFCSIFISNMAVASLYVVDGNAEDISLQSGRPVASRGHIQQFTQMNGQNYTGNNRLVIRGTARNVNLPGWDIFIGSHDVFSNSAQKTEEKKLTQSNVIKNIKQCVVEWEQRSNEAGINNQNHSNNYLKENSRHNAYWEGYALGQQDELKLNISKLKNFLTEIERENQTLNTINKMEVCMKEWNQRSNEAKINNQNHSNNYLKENSKHNAYWEGYALGQHQELLFHINKLNNFVIELKIL